MIRPTCFLLALSAIVSQTSAREPSAVEQPLARKGRPNIVFIMTDDQAPWAVGVAGAPNVKTPTLDKLFKSGAYLRNSFTPTPVCSPSRASLMTSRYGSELGITDWINPGREPELGLDPATVTFPELLQEAGYATGLVGKWHLGLPDQFHPTKTGFDYFMGFRGGGNKPKDPTLEKDGKEQKFEGFTPDILTDHALGFLERQTSEKPFFLAVHFRAPHAAWLPVAEEDWDPFKDLDPEIPNPEYPKLDTDRVKRVTREYLASVASVDRNVGRLMEKLGQPGLVENTVVIFTSDHGYNMGHNGIWHKANGHWILTDPPAGTANVPRGQRPNMYDNSLRLPTAIAWPAVIPAGVEITDTVSMLDWYPTLLELAGVPLPKEQTIRGRSLVALLRHRAGPAGAEPFEWDNEFYGEYSTHHQSETHMRAWRTPQWKLIRDFKNEGRDELYDLVNDPAETNNLIASDDAAARRAIAELHGKIVKRMQEVGDPILEDPEVRARLEL